MAPILGRVHVIYGDKVQFLTVAFDKNVKRVQRFAQSEKHAWPYLMGTQQIGTAYKLDGVRAGRGNFIVPVLTWLGYDPTDSIQCLICLKAHGVRNGPRVR
jgi:hypothetical protein